MNGMMDVTKLQVVLLVGLVSVAAAQFLNNKPWPTYSLSNMPRTSFTCRDKILGGYYADPETQCQMFHVCVKVAGVGTQDFRFLCPNGTAFDQDAQICADWGDVDCEQSTLYYSSDNFDLYRIGSGFESKRAPYADEDEATFHLQRAETSDARRSKQTVVNQSANVKQVTALNPEPFAKTNIYVSPNQFQSSKVSDSPKLQPKVNNNQQLNTRKAVVNENVTPQAPVIDKNTNNNGFYQAQNQQIDVSKNSGDDIFKGSSSSNFFNNRNNGKEDDFDDHYVKETVTTRKPHIRGRQRGRTNSRNGNVNNISSDVKTFTTTTTSTTTSTTTKRPEIYTTTQKVYTSPLQAQFTGNFNFSSVQPLRQSENTRSPIPTSTTFSYSPTAPYIATTTTPAPIAISNTPTPQPEFFKIRSSTIKYNNQKQITFKPSPVDDSIYNPRRNNQPSENPFYNLNYEIHRQSTAVPASFTSTTTTTKVPRPFSQQIQSRSFNSNSNTNNDFNEQINRFNQFQSVDSKNERPTTTTTIQPTIGKQQRTGEFSYSDFQNQDVLRTDKSHFRKVKVTKTLTSSFTPEFNPTTFSPSTYIANKQTPAPFESSSPRGFSYNTNPTTFKPITAKSVDEKYQTISRSTNNENFTPSTVKKFSTLVPRDSYNPTTFRPSTFRKPTEQTFNKIAEKVTEKFAASSYLPTTSTTTQNPADIDEDDGQYHPELYEKDFARNKLKNKSIKGVYNANNFNGNNNNNNKFSSNNNNLNTNNQQQNQFNNRITNFQQASTTESSLEDEFLNTAHSQNIAASGNELRREKARQSAPQAFSKAPTIPPNATTTKKLPKKDKDVSYDYAYYDTGNTHDNYSEYDLGIEDFGKTKTSRKH